MAQTIPYKKFKRKVLRRNSNFIKKKKFKKPEESFINLDNSNMEEKSFNKTENKETFKMRKMNV